MWTSILLCWYTLIYLHYLVSSIKDVRPKTDFLDPLRYLSNFVCLKRDSHSLPSPCSRMSGSYRTQMSETPKTQNIMRFGRTFTRNTTRPSVIMGTQNIFCFGPKYYIRLWTSFLCLNLPPPLLHPPSVVVHIGSPPPPICPDVFEGCRDVGCLNSEEKTVFWSLL